MQPEAEHGHVLAGDLAKIRTVRAPVARRARHPMQFDDWHRPTINGALPIGAQVQQAQATLPNEMASIHQHAVPVKPVLRWHIRKHVLLRFPLAHQRGFFVPRSAFADQRHCQQLAGPALRRWPWSLESGPDFSPQIVHRHLHPQAKIVKTRYHRSVSRLRQLIFGDLSLPQS